MAAHLNEMDSDGSHFRDQRVDLLVVARSPGAPPQLLAVDPRHYTHRFPADRAGPCRFSPVVLGSGAEEEIGVANFLSRDVAPAIIPERDTSLPFVGNLLAVSEHWRQLMRW